MYPPTHTQGGIYRVHTSPSLPGCIYGGMPHLASLGVYIRRYASPSLPGCVYRVYPTTLASLGVYMGVYSTLASLGV